MHVPVFAPVHYLRAVALLLSLHLVALLKYVESGRYGLPSAASMLALRRVAMHQYNGARVIELFAEFPIFWGVLLVRSPEQHYWDQVLHTLIRS